MKKSFKAALISALLGAGAGHLYLKRYRRGAILLLSSLSCLLLIMTRAVKQAQVILDKIEPENGPVDFDKIAGLVAEVSTDTDLLITNGATVFIVMIWTVGVFDAYRIGREMESADKGVVG